MRLSMAASRASVAAIVVLCANFSPLADTSDVPGPIVDQPADGEPGLACGMRVTPARPTGTASTTFMCWASGAPAGDTSFTVQVFRIAGDGTARALDSASADGSLSDGAGVCTIPVNDLDGGPLLAGFVVAGTFQPSGTPIGPMRVSPTI